jgi:hypothetical protein
LCAFLISSLPWLAHRFLICIRKRTSIHIYILDARQWLDLYSEGNVIVLWKLIWT